MQFRAVFLAMLLFVMSQSSTLVTDSILGEDFELFGEAGTEAQIDFELNGTSLMVNVSGVEGGDYLEIINTQNLAVLGEAHWSTENPNALQSLTIEVENGSCACLVIIHSLLQGNLVSEALFVGDSPLPPIILLTDYPDTERAHRGTITIAGEVAFQNGTEAWDARLLLCQDALSTACTDLRNDAFSPNLLADTFPVNWTWEGNNFLLTFSWEDVERPDGEYQLSFTLQDATLQRSNSLVVQLLIDTIAPDVSISGPDVVDESDSTYLIDATASNDASSLQFSWLIYMPDGTVRGPSSEELVIEEDNPLLRRVNIGADISGEWIFEVTITDSAGNRNSSTHSMNVTNRLPIVAMSADGMALQDGDFHRLTANQTWIFSANNTWDTANDAPNLQFEWSLDGETIAEQSWVELHDSDMVGTKRLTVLVSDDDGATDSLSVDLVIAGSSTDPLSNSDEGMKWLTGAAILILLVISLYLGLQLVLKRKPQRSMPKWTGTRKTDSEGEAEVPDESP